MHCPTHLSCSTAWLQMSVLASSSAGFSSTRAQSTAQGWQDFGGQITHYVGADGHIPSPRPCAASSCTSWQGAQPRQRLGCALSKARAPATLPRPAMATERVRERSMGRCRYAGWPLYHHTNSRADSTPGRSCARRTPGQRGRRAPMCSRGGRSRRRMPGSAAAAARALAGLCRQGRRMATNRQSMQLRRRALRRTSPGQPSLRSLSAPYDSTTCTAAEKAGQHTSNGQ